MPTDDGQVVVGFIGLGNIGGPTAECLDKAGVRPHVHPINATERETLDPLSGGQHLTRSDHILDLVGGVADFAQHVPRMLTEKGWVAVQPTWRLG